jgi:signal transduction histidine kinase
MRLEQVQSECELREAHKAIRLICHRSLRQALVSYPASGVAALVTKMPSALEIAPGATSDTIPAIEPERDSTTILRVERSRVARDLHDRVLQDLIGSVLQLRRLISAAQSNAESGALTNVFSAVTTALDATRQILRELREQDRPRADDDTPVRLSDAVFNAMQASPLGSANHRTDIRGDFFLEARVGREIERIVREAVVNAARHSKATSIKCTVWDEDAHACIQVEDDGVGFEMCTGKLGMGLLGMSERAVLIGADLQVKSQPMAGTSVMLRLGTSQSWVRTPDGARSAR